MTSENLRVLLNGREVGHLTHLKGQGFFFGFNEDYIKDSDRPLLSVCFKDVHGELVHKTATYHSRLPPFFSPKSNVCVQLTP